MGCSTELLPVLFKPLYVFRNIDCLSNMISRLTVLVVFSEYVLLRLTHITKLSEWRHRPVCDVITFRRTAALIEKSLDEATYSSFTDWPMGCLLCPDTPEFNCSGSKPPLASSSGTVSYCRLAAVCLELFTPRFKHLDGGFNTVI